MSHELIVFQKSDTDKNYRAELAIQFGPVYSSIIRIRDGREGDLRIVVANEALMDLAKLINERFPLDMLGRIT